MQKDCRTATTVASIEYAVEGGLVSKLSTTVEENFRSSYSDCVVSPTYFLTLLAGWLVGWMAGWLTIRTDEHTL